MGDPKGSKFLISIIILLILFATLVFSVSAAPTSLNVDAAVVNYEGKVNGVSFSYEAPNTSCTVSHKASGNNAVITIKSTATGNLLTGYTNQITYFHITNNESFDINATIAFNNANVNGQSGTVKIGAGQTVTFSVESGDSWGLSAPNKSGTVTISALVPDISGYSTLFQALAGGTYSVTCSDNTTVTQGAPHTTTSAEEYTLTLTSTNTADGYTFCGWMHSSLGIISTASSTTYKTSEVYNGCSVYPVFKLNDYAMYYIKGEGNEYYYYLDEAIAAATSDTSGTILVLASGQVAATETYANNSANYDTDGNLKFTLGNGQELVVPYSTADETHFGQPEYMMASPAGVYYEKLTNATKKFRELIIPAYVTIVCSNGSAINVDAIQRADDSASFPGTVGGYYGQITLLNDTNDSAKIILESGANLYCYGFIVAQDHNGNINRETATGEVIAKSGSHVYEFLEISDWRGGSCASFAATGGLMGNNGKVDSFVFSQYYVQNIASTFTIHTGATETVWFALSYEGTEHMQEDFEFIGSSALFRLGTNSYLTRKYDASTDRMSFHAYGDLTLDSMQVSLTMGTTSESPIPLNSSSYIFGLQSNYSIYVHSGTITVNQRFKMHPGCYVEVMKDATLNFGSSGKLYIYSKDDFDGNFIYAGKAIAEDPKTPTTWTYGSTTELGISTSQFVPGRGNGGYDLGRTVRTWANTGDAQLVINGELVSNGNVYCTTSGKGLSGTGKITASAVANDASFTEFVQANYSTLNARNCPVTVNVSSVKGQLAGISAAKDDVQKLGAYTYYGTESDGWYNYLVKAKYTDGASAVNGVAVTAPADSTSHTVTRYVAATDTSAATTEEITDVVGYVTYDSAGAQNTFTFTTTPSNATVTTDQGTLSDSGSPYSLTGVQNDATLTLTLFDVEFTQIVLGNALDMRFAFAESNMANWAGAKVVVVKEYADGRDNVEKEYAFDKGEWVQTTINGNTYYYVTFDDISAKEMADSIHIVICDANGVRISNRKTETVRDYIVRVLNNGSQSDAAKTMLVDMLNYGAAAQTYYKYGSDNLANAELTTDQQSLGTQSTPEYEDKRKQGGNFNGTRLELKNSIDMHLVFSGLSDGMYATITHESHWGNQVATENVEYCTDEDGKTYFDVDQIVVADGRQLVTVTVYNSDGETVYGKVTDSVEGYVARTMGDSNASEELKELCLRILMFSDSAKTYLATT